MHSCYTVAMKAITVRNLPPRIAKEIRERAQRDRSSLNGTVIRMLEERLGEAAPGEKKKKRRDLSFLRGTWTKKEADEFNRALAQQRTIDKELWK
jgi:hypothetical protein